jgi:hypothetical protein
MATEKTYAYIGHKEINNFLAGYIGELGSEVPYNIPSEEYKRVTKEVNDKFGTSYSHATVRGQILQMKKTLQIASFKKCSNVVVDGKIQRNYVKKNETPISQTGRPENTISTLQQAVQNFSSILERNQQLEAENKELKEKNQVYIEMLRSMKEIREAVNKFNAIHCPRGVHK